MLKDENVSGFIPRLLYHGTTGSIATQIRREGFHHGSFWTGEVDSAINHAMSRTGKNQHYVIFQVDLNDSEFQISSQDYQGGEWVCRGPLGSDRIKVEREVRFRNGKWITAATQHQITSSIDL